MNNIKILTAMSGGVDSAAAACLLSEAGYDVTGITLLLSGNRDDATAAADICDTVGIPHIVLDMREDFERLVVTPFIGSYIGGETPNPCVICNKRIKFGKLHEYAAENGFEKVATGHYVRLCERNGIPVLYRAADLKKDQTYMLWQLSEAQLSRSLFPLGTLTKPEVRAFAAARGFSNADRKDSQDICFVPDGDYAAFIERKTGNAPVCGDFIDGNGNTVGRHGGMLRYTVGQRKGLGTAFGKPVYVTDKNAGTNTVTLGTDEMLYRREIFLHSAQLSASVSLPGRFDVKIRYAHTPAKAVVSDCGNGKLRITFDEPQRAPARGQSAVLYSADMLAGGGFID